MTNLTLKPYQVEGAEWLRSIQGGCLADQMGLGKTVQVVMALPEDLKRLVILCPAGALSVWETHLEDWRPDLSHLPVIIAKTGMKSLPEEGIILVSYGIVFRGILAGLLAKWEPEVLVADEAHYLKTKDTKRTQAALRISVRSARVWLVSGTPAPNDVSEFFSLMNISSPERLMDARSNKPMNFWQWRDKFCKVRETKFGTQIVGTKNKGMLKSRLDGWFLRRKTKDVLKDLPLIRIRDYPLPIDLETLTREERNELIKLADSVNLTHLADLIKSGAPDKDDTVQRMRQTLGILKAEAMKPMVEELLAEHEKIVLFGWHTRVVRRLFDNAFEYEPAHIDGSTPLDLRKREVSRFQEDPNCRVFCGQILAAGTAITLTAASCVRIVEPSTVPGENLQAIFRIYRIGQKAQSVDAGLVYGVHPKLGKADKSVSRALVAKIAELAEILD